MQNDPCKMGKKHVFLKDMALLIYIKTQRINAKYGNSRKPHFTQNLSPYMHSKFRATKLRATKYLLKLNSWNSLLIIACLLGRVIYYSAITEIINFC